MKTRLVTIYTKTEFMGNIAKHEGRLIGFGTKQYAQYNNAPFVDFIPKQKRNGIRFLKTHNPYLVVLNGVGHPEPGSMMVPTNNLTISKSCYSSFDERWATDFDSKLDNYLATKKPEVLLDARETKGFSSY